jgi:hypothetical protein
VRRRPNALYVIRKREKQNQNTPGRRFPCTNPSFPSKEHARFFPRRSKL